MLRHPCPHALLQAEVSQTLCCLAIPADMSVANFCTFIGAYLGEVRSMQVRRVRMHTRMHSDMHAHTAAAAHVRRRAPWQGLHWDCHLTLLQLLPHSPPALPPPCRCCGARAASPVCAWSCSALPPRSRPTTSTQTSIPCPSHHWSQTYSAGATAQHVPRGLGLSTMAEPGCCGLAAKCRCAPHHTHSASHHSSSVSCGSSSSSKRRAV